MKFPDSLYPDHDFPDRVARHGHAGQPGNGPKGEKCKTCAHYTLRHYSKVYRKCWLIKKNWTNGAGTDIRANDPACEYWEVEEQ